MTCLAWAAGRGYTEIVRELIQHGAKVNVADKVSTAWTNTLFMICVTVLA